MKKMKGMNLMRYLHLILKYHLKHFVELKP
jgi:hypothetical protein